MGGSGSAQCHGLPGNTEMNVASKLLLAAMCAIPVLSSGAAVGATTAGPTLPPLGDSWPTYSGDFTGKRYSSLQQINQTNVKNLTLAWATRLKGGMDEGGG